MMRGTSGVEGRDWMNALGGWMNVEVPGYVELVDVWMD